MSNMNQSLRVLAILADADHEAFLTGATAARCARTVRKLYDTAANGPITTRIDADTSYCAFSTVGGGLSTETDPFDGLRPSPTLLAVAA